MTAVSYGTEGSGAASAWDDDGGRSVAEAPALSVAEATALAIPDGLDWAAFSARCFPGRQRHDFEAVKAYEAYGKPQSPPIATTAISDRKLMAADIQIALAYARQLRRSGLAAPSDVP